MTMIFELNLCKSIPELFEIQAEKNPNRIAVEFHEYNMTYSELNKKSNQLANEILSLTDTFNARICICIERSLEQIIAILGVLKSGATYVPVDPHWPQKKIDLLIKKIDPEICIVHSATKEKFTKISTINLDHHYNTPDIMPKKNIKANHLAYIIFTSGSTGEPKGVMINHGSVINLINSQINNFKISMDRILLTSEIFFDASIEQIFLAILSGSTLVCLDQTTLKDIDKLEKYILNKDISHLHATPALLSQLTHNIAPVLRRIISGGDVCPPCLANNWVGLCDFYNEYGPTEATCTALISKITQPINGRVPIGKPLPNVNCYIVRDNRTVSDFQAGELWLSGKGVSNGYFNSLELTQDKFTKTDLDDLVVYKTGDICRWTPDGEIEFLGRNDFQVKFNGYRIELQEVEAVILSYSKIIDAVVIFVNDTLVALCQGDTAGLKSYLHERLATYMIPTFIEKLDVFPTMSNGKIDRDKLKKEYQFSQRTPKKEDKYDHVINDLINIWRNILSFDDFSIEDDFFHIGGDSIKAMHTVNKIREAFNIEMEMCFFIANPIISVLAEHVIQKQTNKSI